MSLKLKCSKAIFYSTVVSLTHKVMNYYCVIIIFVELSFLNTPVLAEHLLDCPGDPPTGDFSFGPAIPTGSGGYYTGRNVYIELYGYAEDLDVHWPETWTMEHDFFHKW
jgi:hypothetical protein